MKGRLSYLLYLIAFLPGSFFAQEPETDTLDIPSSYIISGFEDNLDSLLNLWYVDQQLNIDDVDSGYFPEMDTMLIDFPDSVYIARLASLPFIIEMSYNRTVRNFITLYTSQRRERVRVMLTLSKYYFPMFEDVLDQYQLPTELKYMAIVESALNPRAVSRAGATGIWQFMYYTAKSNGLTVNSLVDERRDPYASTVAAAKFMSKLYEMYNDWTLVIAAYNCGPGNVNKAIRRSGGKRNYWDIYYYLPRETRGYVPAFIAAAYVMNFAEEHNLKPVPVDFVLNNDTIIVKEKLHLMQVAEVLNIPINQLRDLNPQYKIDIIPGDRDYILRIPGDRIMAFIDLEDSIFNYNDSIFFDPSKMTVNPTANNYSTPSMPSDKFTKLTYRVKDGDNLGFISMWYNVRVSDLRYWNNIRSNMIRADQKLAIYVPNAKADQYRDIDKLSFAEKQKRIGKTVTENVNSSPVQKPDDGNYITYRVRQGDSLWEIAKKYPGISDTDIAKLNNIDKSSSIQPGQVLKIRRN